MSDLRAVRNVKPSFNYGRGVGLAHSALSTVVTKGSEPWTLRNGYSCASKTRKASECERVEYAKADGELTFDILSNLQRANTYHEDSEPAHLKVKEGMERMAETESYEVWGAPETRFCPAKVYEFVEDTESGSGEEGTSKMKLVINAQNCIHCKSCDIKAPKEYIRWTVPQGGGGPK